MMDTDTDLAAFRRMLATGHYEPPDTTAIDQHIREVGREEGRTEAEIAAMLARTSALSVQS